MRDTSLSWQSIWITGASSGIGRALAVNLATRNRRLILSARNADRLETVADECRTSGAEVVCVTLDLGVEQSRTAAFEAVCAAGPVPDVLINNAGVSQRSLAIETDFSVDRTITEVNYLGAVHITKLVLSDMVERNRGYIIAVSSIAGRLAAPLRSAYNGAKAAQISYFRTLQNELHRSGVTISIAIPGFVRTDVSRNALIKDGDRYGRLDGNQAGGISAEEAAKDIIRGMSRRQRTIVTGIPFRARFLLGIERLAPTLADLILRNVGVT